MAVGGTESELTKSANRIVSNRESVFIEGFPGSGKTYFCRNFLIPRLERRTSVCMAPTNRAAINLNGKTIHSHFGVHAEEEDDHRYSGIFL